VDLNAELERICTPDPADRPLVARVKALRPDPEPELKLVVGPRLRVVRDIDESGSDLRERPLDSV
jgi:hypothetical protein